MKEKKYSVGYSVLNDDGSLRDVYQFSSDPKFDAPERALAWGLSQHEAYFFETESIIVHDGLGDVLSIKVADFMKFVNLNA